MSALTITSIIFNIALLVAILMYDKAFDKARREVELWETIANDRLKEIEKLKQE